MSAALGHLAVSYGGHRAHIVAVDRILAASGGLEPDESVSVDKRNVNRTSWRHGIGVSPSNGSFSMAITNAHRAPISETRPISRACQRVTSVIDSNLYVCFSERDQRILAASRSGKRALLHREREGGFDVDSQYVLTLGLCRSRIVNIS